MLKWLNNLMNFSRAKKELDSTKKEKDKAILDFKAEVERATRINDSLTSISSREQRYITTPHRTS